MFGVVLVITAYGRVMPLHSREASMDDVVEVGDNLDTLMSTPPQLPPQLYGGVSQTSSVDTGASDMTGGESFPSKRRSRRMTMQRRASKASKRLLVNSTRPR